MLKAIETQYNGYRFRSRLEARWAVYFDTLGIAYEYEKEGFELSDGTRYLPDFWLPQVNMWAEVKPGFDPVAIWKCVCLCRESRHEVVLLDGMPDTRSYFVAGPLCSDYDVLMSDSGDISRETDGGYPGGDYYIPVPCVDVVLSTEYLYESRFYTNTGGQNWPHPLIFSEDEKRFWDDVTTAVIAARSARFEHGERGR